jgi:hypothetical protein
MFDAPASQRGLSHVRVAKERQVFGVYDVYPPGHWSAFVRAGGAGHGHRAHLPAWQEILAAVCPACLAFTAAWPSIQDVGLFLDRRPLYTSRLVEAPPDSCLRAAAADCVDAAACEAGPSSTLGLLSDCQEVQRQDRRTGGR